MSIKIILVSMVLMSFDTNNFISGDVSHKILAVFKQTMPRLDITAATGNWYMLATTKPNYNNVCLISKVIPQSENSFRLWMHSNIMIKADISFPIDPLYNSQLYAKVRKTSNVIEVSTKLNGNIDRYITIFDVDYTSHIAIYIVNKEEALNNDSEGTILIMSREKTLPSEIFEKIQQTNFYKQGVNANNKLLSVNTTNC